MSKKLNVLFLPKWYPNEVEPFDGNFIKNYAEGLHKVVNISVLFVHSRHDQKKDFQVNEVQQKPFQEIHVFFKKFNSFSNGINKMVNAWRYFKAQQIGFNKLTNKNYDLCHVHVLSRPAMLALSLKSKFKIPFVISEHWTGYHAHVGGFNGVFRKTFAKYICKQSAGIHTVSEELKEAMQAHQLNGNYTIIPNIVDTSIFQPDFNGRNETTNVIFVGNLIQSHKRVLDIVRTAIELLDEGVKFELNLYGEGKDGSEAQKLISSAKYSKNITLKGVRNRDGIAEAMAKSDFLILFSSFENQPCVINEALCCGIPVVVPNLKGVAENMNDTFGIMYNNNNLQAFKNAFREMILNHKDFTKNNIHQKALQLFSEESTNKQFLEFYINAVD